MPDFVGMRSVWIDLADETRPLPKEFDRFDLYPTQQAGVYDTPYLSLESSEWRELEAALLTLKVEGRCNGWKVVNVH